MYLFDTDVVSNALRKRPSASLMRRLRGVDPREQFISSITVAEIAYGAWKSDRREHHLRNLREVVLASVQVLDFDLAAAYVAGELRALLERRGTPLAFADLEIAAIALANDLTLVTGNVKHFRRVPGLRVENWLDEGGGPDR